MKLVFVQINHDPSLWRLLKDVQERVIRFSQNEQGYPTALLMCSEVQEGAAGFLRLVLAEIEGAPPHLVGALSVPPFLVAWMADVLPTNAAGFLAHWDWPFPKNATASDAASD